MWAYVIVCISLGACAHVLHVLVVYSHGVKAIEILGASAQRLRQHLQQRLCTLPYPWFCPSEKKPWRGFHDRFLAHVFLLVTVDFCSSISVVLYLPE